MAATDLPLPHAEVAPGQAGDEPLVLVHGFTQTGRSWAPLVPLLTPTGRPVITVDLPGHGATDPRLDGTDLTGIARLLGDTVGPAIHVGYSMGGRVALRLALDRPDLVSALVLLGATAGIDDADERAERRRADAALAEHVESVGTPVFVDEWLAGPLFARLDAAPDDLAGRRGNRPDGLAASLRHAGTGTMGPPWWAELERLTMPVLLVTGEHDAKFAALAARLAAAIGANATRTVVADAGHAAHLERPSATADLILAWLRDAVSPPPSAT